MLASLHLELAENMSAVFIYSEKHDYQPLLVTAGEDDFALVTTCILSPLCICTMLVYSNSLCFYDAAANAFVFR